MLSMPVGPVLSATLCCFVYGGEIWDVWIANPGNYDLALSDTVRIDSGAPLNTFDKLCVAEKDALDSVYAQFGHCNRLELANLLRDRKFCPEWKNPNGSSCPIHIDVLLMKNGKTKEQTDAIVEKLREEDDLRTFTQSL